MFAQFIQINVQTSVKTSLIVSVKARTAVPNPLS